MFLLLTLSLSCLVLIGSHWKKVVSITASNGPFKELNPCESSVNYDYVSSRKHCIYTRLIKSIGRSDLDRLKKKKSEAFVWREREEEAI